MERQIGMVPARIIVVRLTTIVLGQKIRNTQFVAVISMILVVNRSG